MSAAEDRLDTQPPGWRSMPRKLVRRSPYRASIGAIALANDISYEPELRTFLAPSAALYVNRIAFPDRTTVETLRGMRDDITAATAAILPGDPLDVVMFGCTSGSMAIGADEVARCIHAARPGVHATNPISAGMAGLRRLGCRRIALLTPYAGDVNAVVGDFIVAHGFELVACGAFGCRSARDMCNIAPDSILAAGLELGAVDCDGVFLSCTALRVSPVIETLEQRLGKPVVASNQALAWHAMRLAGMDDAVPGCGQLLRTSL